MYYESQRVTVKRRKDQNTTRGKKQYYVLRVVFYTSLRMYVGTYIYSH